MSGQGMINKQKRLTWWALAALAVALGLLVLLWPVITPFFLALLFAYLLQPGLMRLVRLGTPVGLSILVLYLYLLVSLYLVTVFCLPIFSGQLAALAENLPQLAASLRHNWQQATTELRRLPLPVGLEEAVEVAWQNMRVRLGERLADTASRLGLALRALLYLVLTPILGYYMLRDHSSAQRTIRNWLSPESRPELARLANDVNHLLRQFVGGYLLVSLVVALMSAAFYALIGVDYPLALGLIMGIADLIPYFGPLLGAIPAVLVAWGDSAALALVTAIGLLLLQQAEGSVITPRIMGDRIGLHPLTTIFAVMAGGYLAGILGTILAVPVAAALILIGKYIYSRWVGVRAEEFF